MRNNEIEDMIADAWAWCRARERKFLEDWCKEAHLTEPIAYTYEHGKGFTIYTTRPGLLIGKAGRLFNKYRDIMLAEFGENNGIKLVEIGGGFVNHA